LYASLLDFVKDSRNMFDHFEKKVKEKLPDVDYKKSKYTGRKRHINDDESDANYHYTYSCHFSEFFDLFELRFFEKIL
jgi:hypothetical protein